MAAIEHWRDTNNILAKLIDKRDIKGYARKDLILDPGEAAVLVSEGRIADTLTQTRLKNVGGGWKGWMSRKLKTGKDLKLLLLDTKPFQLTFQVKAPTADHMEARGEATVHLQFSLEQAPLILGMIREKPIYVKKGVFRKKEEISEYVMMLTKEQLRERLASEMAAKVFATVLANFKASQLRETQTQSRLDTATQIELRKTLGLWGLNLQTIYVNWQETEYDRFKAEKAAEDLAAEHELERTARIAEADRERRWKEEQLRLEIEKREDAQDAEQLTQLVKLKGQMKEQKIKEFQGTELARTQVEAQRDIEVAKHSLDTFKEAQASERTNQLNMMGEMAKVFSGQQGASVPQSDHQVSGTGNPPGTPCPQCKAPLQSGWKACPECGWLMQR